MFTDFIQQTVTDTDVSGVIVPKNYVNLTQLCEGNPFEKLKWYFSDKRTLDIFLSLSQKSTLIATKFNHFENSIDFGLFSGLLIKTTNDIYCDVNIVCHIATCINRDFSFWGNRLINLMAQNKIDTVEFEDARRNLENAWDEFQTKIAE